MNRTQEEGAALGAALERLQAALEGKTPFSTEEPPRLAALGKRMGLSAFERTLLLACAGMELRPELSQAFSAAGGGRGPAHPTLAWAMSALPDPNWMAATPEGAVRLWRMIEIGEGGELLHARLRIDERMLHHLVGTDPLDERLQPLCRPAAAGPWLPPTLAAAAVRIASRLGSPLAPPVIQVISADREDGLAVACAAARQAGREPFACAAEDLPAAPAERRSFARLWSRESLLAGRALLLDVREADPLAVRRAGSMAGAIAGAVFLIGPEPVPCGGREVHREDLEAPTPEEQRLLWLRGLGADAASVNGHLERVIGHFRLGTATLERAAGEARRALRSGVEAGSALWQAARDVARPRLSELAQRIHPDADWEDLVLPAREMAALRAVAAHVRHRHRIHHEWGFAGRGGRGLGVSALFSGPSGTGKTMAAEVLAADLGLDLYRIDLSAVVSKYIGETEKNLRAVFDAAEQGGGVLLFDEADALFGKRSEVRDSHDRYANIEVGYLLQRMESFRGLALLTTNMRTALDHSFLRRIRFVIAFPFPSPEDRIRIWRSALPRRMPAEGLDLSKLARLNVTGGTIRSMALNGAALAAEAGDPMRMRHLLEAARLECAKLERPLTAAEIEGW